jgi:hypothetical protein
MDAASMAIQFLPSDLRESLIVEHLLAVIFHSSKSECWVGEKKGCPASKRIEQPMVRINYS